MNVFWGFREKIISEECSNSHGIVCPIRVNLTLGVPWQSMASLKKSNLNHKLINRQKIKPPARTRIWCTRIPSWLPLEQIQNRISCVSTAPNCAACGDRERWPPIRGQGRCVLSFVAPFRGRASRACRRGDPDRRIPAARCGSPPRHMKGSRSGAFCVQTGIKGFPPSPDTASLRLRFVSINLPSFEKPSFTTAVYGAWWITSPPS